MTPVGEKVATHAETQKLAEYTCVELVRGSEG
jgi:hypothetical protein